MVLDLGRAARRNLDVHVRAVSWHLAADEAYVLGVTDQELRVRRGWAERLGIPDYAGAEVWQALRECDLDLWTRVDPEVQAELAAIRSAGVRLAVLSNANGDVDGR